MVTIHDGGNVFEVVGRRRLKRGDWFINPVDAHPDFAHSDFPQVGDPECHILRPISGPAARPERRKDAETRKWFEKCIASYDLTIARLAYRRGYAFAVANRCLFFEPERRSGKERRALRLYGSLGSNRRYADRERVKGAERHPNDPWRMKGE